MGGQQFGADTVLVDTRSMKKILAFDKESGILEVEAGIQWPELIAGYLEKQEGDARPWGIAQKQTGADRLCIGGALASNVHGRGLKLKPFDSDVESFRLVDADGAGQDVQPRREPEALLARGRRLRPLRRRCIR